MSSTKDLGAVTAYAEAVEGGYTGTYEEFCDLLGKFSERADEVKTNADAVAADLKSAETAAESAETHAANASKSAEDAAESAANASASETNAKESADTASTKASAAATSATNAKTSETNASKSATAAAESEARAFSTTPDGYEEVVSQVNANTKQIAALVATSDPTIYGFHIDGNEADPDAAVRYLKDAVGMTPAKMDCDNDVFDYGSWEDAFFMPRPCMLNQDGTVAYYLDPNDFTKKEDGTDSDVADSTYAGNAMMEWGRDGQKIWLKVVPKGSDNTSADVFISNMQVTEDYHAWSFMDANGAYIDHFYTPIYNSSEVDNVLRSISGQASHYGWNVTIESKCAKANGTGWFIETFGDRLLIDYLLILIGKSLNTQAVFGNGILTGGADAVNTYITGTANDKGLFYGSTANNTTVVKVFGMENYWGLQGRRTAGLVTLNGSLYYKLTESDADGASGGYTENGTDYIAGPATPVSSNSFTKTMLFAADGSMLNKAAGGSSETYYCDSSWMSPSGNGKYAVFGGNAGSGLGSGAFFVDLSFTPSIIRWNADANLSYRPIAT